MSKTMFPNWAFIGATVIFCEETEEPLKGVEGVGLFDLEAGSDYLIRDLLWSPFFDEPYVLLENIRHRPQRYLDSNEPYEWGYLLRYFRPPVSEQMSTDIETFRKIASNLPTAKELEDSVQLALERLG